MKSIRFNDLSKASQIFAESFVEKEPKIKSRKNLNESINEALSDEAKANNEMIQKILNKKPSQLTAKEKKFLADNDLVRDNGTGGDYSPSIRKNGAPWYNSISKGDSFINNRNNRMTTSKITSIDDVDQLGLLNKRHERDFARYKASKDPDILATSNRPWGQGPSQLQSFNNLYADDIKGAKTYAKNAKDYIDSYIETGKKWKADAAKYSADESRMYRDHAKKRLEYRPKFESLEKGLSNWRGVPGIKFKSNGSWGDPDLIYHGYTFNYWDIEDALWSDFLEETGYDDSDSDNPEVEQEFNKWLKDTAKPYLDDVIYGGYFKKGSRSWHDNY